ncbi:MAG: glycosyltransferase [bacterium]
MRIAINAINLTSAGTLVTGKELLRAISALKTRSHRYLVVAPSGFGYEALPLGENWQWKFFSRWKKENPLWRIWFDFFLFPSLVRDFKADAVMALGNHAPVRLPIPVLVLLRNSFYVDNDRYSYPSTLKKMKKYLEIKIFSRTVRHADLFVVQSSYMKTRLAAVWKVSEKRISVIPNAVASNIMAAEDISKNEGRPSNMEGKAGGMPEKLDHKMLWLYVSRYYPHKNHRFILSLAEHLKRRGIEDLAFIITLDPQLPGVQSLMNAIVRQGLSDMVINVGELSTDQLSAWYQRADGLFFPSYLESFGNPLLEALGFGLPICTVDLPYSRVICEDSAVYYRMDSIEDAARKLLSLKENPSLLAEVARKGKQHFLSFPHWDEVAKRYLSLLEKRV